ncbi:3-beta-hydroxysteroid sulfotransferase-like [Cricetulus griseus]|uniref:Sulfotransferase n=1 Tax=Cricetulus griseus TaxID=10029 RepID=A0A9J7GMN6_CRIGR|nr:3-beta-hydroxysteroid sulfotransferase-like [Cricetulus griseus]
MTDNITWFSGIQIVPGLFTVENLSFAQNFLMKDDDVILVTYPRSGTHWMIEIVSLILSKGDPTWVQTVNSHTRFLWIEDKDSQKLLKGPDRPRLLATHLPIHLFPKSCFTSRAKIIYIIRNPRDVATSIYHIRKYTPNVKIPKNFEEFLNAFIHGELLYGSWFDHTLGWLTRRNTENFLLMSYEELQKDLRGNMQKLCQFLGNHLSPEQLDSVVQNSSFSVMKDNKMSNSIRLKNPEDETDSNVPLLRKGRCGDWKNHFTVTQSEAFDKIYQEKMSSLDPGLFPWSEV